LPRAGAGPTGRRNLYNATRARSTRRPRATHLGIARAPNAGRSAAARARARFFPRPVFRATRGRRPARPRGRLKNKKNRISRALPPRCCSPSLLLFQRREHFLKAFAVSGARPEVFLPSVKGAPVRRAVGAGRAPRGGKTTSVPGQDGGTRRASNGAVFSVPARRCVASSFLDRKKRKERRREKMGRKRRFLRAVPLQDERGGLRKKDALASLQHRKLT